MYMYKKVCKGKTGVPLSKKDLSNSWREREPPSEILVPPTGERHLHLVVCYSATQCDLMAHGG